MQDSLGYIIDALQEDINTNGERTLTNTDLLNILNNATEEQSRNITAQDAWESLNN